MRLAEQLERSRDQAVDRVRREGRRTARVELRLQAHEDVTIARWAAMSEADVFKQAFGRELEISVGPKARTTAR